MQLFVVAPISLLLPGEYNWIGLQKDKGHVGVEPSFLACTSEVYTGPADCLST